MLIFDNNLAGIVSKPLQLIGLFILQTLISIVCFKNYFSH